MDDIDIGGIDEILKQAARIRNDANALYMNKDVNPKYIGSYECKGCGEENSSLSSWCFRCGLSKFAKPSKPQLDVSHSVENNTKCHVYNTDQLLEPKCSERPVNEPREINTTKINAGGDLKVFQYNQSNGSKQDTIEIKYIRAPAPHVESPVENNRSEEESFECPSFSSEDIIIYDRCENKKNKKRLYIKPLSSSSLISTTLNSPTTIKNAWATPVTKQARPSSTPPRAKNGRPSSATKPTLQNKPALLPRKHHNSSSSKKSLNSSLTPSVFERLYKNEAKPKIRSVQSSPHLITTDKNRKTKPNSVIALSAPQIR